MSTEATVKVAVISAAITEALMVDNAIDFCAWSSEQPFTLPHPKA